jgi:hypothetical protein
MLPALTAVLGNRVGEVGLAKNISSFVGKRYDMSVYAVTRQNDIMVPYYRRHIESLPVDYPIPKYFYQYEEDGNNYSYYERIMSYGEICIQANSEAEASVLSRLLREVVDSNPGMFIDENILDEYFENNGIDLYDAEFATEENVIQAIDISAQVCSDCLSYYRDYRFDASAGHIYDRELIFTLLQSDTEHIVPDPVVSEYESESESESECRCGGGYESD